MILLGESERDIRGSVLFGNQGLQLTDAGFSICKLILQFLILLSQRMVCILILLIVLLFVRLFKIDEVGGGYEDIQVKR